MLDDHQFLYRLLAPLIRSLLLLVYVAHQEFYPTLLQVLTAQVMASENKFVSLNQMI